MKLRALLSTTMFAVVALALTVPAVGQSLNWQIPLRSETARNSGSADYSTLKTSHKFTVETLTPSLADGAKLDVFVGPASNVKEPYGKFVGTIEVDRGIGAMILVAANAPLVRDGTTVTIVEHGETAAGVVIMKGTF
jgi:hypothetical protein